MTLAVRPSSLTARAAALLLRPLLIFFGTTQMAHLLLSAGEATGLASYPRWLASAWVLRPVVLDGIAPSALLAGQGLAAGLVLAVGPGLFLRRAARRQRAGGWVWLVVLATATPAVAVTVRWWAGQRWGLDVTGAPSLVDRPGRAVATALVPSLVVGGAVAAPLAALITGPGIGREPFGFAALGTGLAERAESREGWWFGLPVTSLITAVLVVEAAFDRPGLGSALLDSLRRNDATAVLDVVAVVAVTAAAAAIVVDMVGLRPDGRLRPTGPGRQLLGATAPAWSRAGLATGVVASIAVVAGAGLGVASDRAEAGLPAADAGARALAFDEAVHQAAADLLPALTAALAPASLAVVAALGLVAIQRAVGSVGEVVPGALVDAAWWTPAVMVLVATAASGTGTRPLDDPLLLLVVAAASVAPAMRALRRERADLAVGGLHRVAGVWLIVAGFAFAAHLAATFAATMPSPTGAATALDAVGPGGAGARPLPLGAQLARGAGVLGDGVWGVVAPGAAACLVLFALHTSGAALVQLGWRRTLVAALDEAASGEAITIGRADGGARPERPPISLAPDDDNPEAAALIFGAPPVPLVDEPAPVVFGAPTGEVPVIAGRPAKIGREATATPRTTATPQAPDPHGDDADRRSILLDDEAPTPSDGRLTPNYALQPGLPVPGPGEDRSVTPLTDVAGDRRRP
ncbi:MAG: hypothetical protein ACFCVK_06120 [Acidimicrobiales bacterium]